MRKITINVLILKFTIIMFDITGNNRLGIFALNVCDCNIQIITLNLVYSNARSPLFVKKEKRLTGAIGILAPYKENIQKYLTTFWKL